MSVCFILRTRKTEGRAPLVARIQSPKLGVNILSTTTIDVDIVKYTASPKGKLHTIYMKLLSDISIKIIFLLSIWDAYRLQHIAKTTSSCLKTE